MFPYTVPSLFPVNPFAIPAVHPQMLGAWTFNQSYPVIPSAFPQFQFQQFGQFPQSLFPQVPLVDPRLALVVDPRTGLVVDQRTGVYVDPRVLQNAAPCASLQQPFASLQQQLWQQPFASLQQPLWQQQALLRPGVASSAVNPLAQQPVTA